MPANDILALLIAERDMLNRATDALQGPSTGRGRPAKAPEAAAPAKKRKGMSAARRKAQGERMKAYWAARRKKQAKG